MTMNWVWIEYKLDIFINTWWNKTIPPGALADFSLTISSQGVTIRNEPKTQALQELTSILKSCIKGIYGFNLSVEGKIRNGD